MTELYKSVLHLLDTKEELPANYKGRILFETLIEKDEKNIYIKIKRHDIYVILRDKFKYEPKLLSGILDEINNTYIIINRKKWVDFGEYSIKSYSGDNEIHYHYWYKMNLDRVNMEKHATHKKEDLRNNEHYIYTPEHEQLHHNITNMRIESEYHPTIKNHVLISKIDEYKDEEYSRHVYRTFKYIKSLLIDLMHSLINQYFI